MLYTLLALVTMQENKFISTVTISLEEYEKLKLDSNLLRQYKGDNVLGLISPSGNFEIRSNFNCDRKDLNIDINMNKIPKNGIITILKTM